MVLIDLKKESNIFKSRNIIKPQLPKFFVEKKKLFEAYPISDANILSVTKDFVGCKNLVGYSI